MIGQLITEQAARNFGDALYVQGIKSQVESEREGCWSIWIFEEEQIEQAKELFRQFQLNPAGNLFQNVARQAQEKRLSEEKADQEFRGRVFDRESLLPTPGGYGLGVATGVLIGISVLVAVLSQLGEDRSWFSILRLTGAGVREGEFWRLLTPIFLHFSLAHILFNMLWMKDLGSMIEARQGTIRLLLLVVLIGVASNAGQYLVSGSNFGGMSGVVYGLLGYIWINGKLDRRSGLYLNPQEVTLAVVWFALCFTGWLGPIANTAHAVGLFLGMCFGFLSAHGVGFRKP